MAEPPAVPQRTSPRGRILPAQKRAYWERRDAGYSIRESAAFAGFSKYTATQIEALEHRANPERFIKTVEHHGIPYTKEQLNDEARKALDDFGLFQRRYFGRVAVPWQEMAAKAIVALLETPHEEYVVVNAPPGSGKSTLFTCDLAAWLIVRDRSIRVQIGSRTGRQAQWYVQRLRRELERTIPVKGELKEVRAGRALDALATLGEDYGAFRPPNRDVWSSDEFVVVQESGVAISEKESTCSAFGMDSGFLGGRYDCVIWDDVVDPNKDKTPEAQEAQERWWDDYAETRLEPGGLLVLQGQRMKADDLYRYNLDKVIPFFDEDDDEVVLANEQLDADADPDEELESPRKYHHVLFKAHYAEKCADGTHKLSAPAYPKGCLLYPRRLPFKKLATIEANQPERYQVVYQQEDADPERVLVLPTWIWGSGEEYPGCIDRDRVMGQVPEGVNKMALLSAATADPSPAAMWSIQWWCHEPHSDFRYLMNLSRSHMDAPSLLDWNHAERRFTGIMDVWQQESLNLGIPISHWIVEINAAQKFLLQYDHVQRWKSLRRVTIVPHTTGRNKADTELGVGILKTLYRTGKKRLPFGDGNAAARSQHLIRELTRYPHGRTDDCVMADWFFEWNLPHLIRPHGGTAQTQWRPSWMRPQDTDLVEATA